MARSAGILLPLFSLPSDFGIGSMGGEARQFLDFLHAAGQGWWQMLPLTPGGGGNSPYSSVSSFAGNPLLIDLDELVENGFLTRKAVEEADDGADASYVDFDKVNKCKMALLREAFAGFTDDVGYTSFVMDEQDWLDDYALFTALKEKFGGKPWTMWDEDIKMREPEAMKRWQEELKDEIKFVLADEVDLKYALHIINKLKRD